MSTDVIVVGAGAIGLSVAQRLAESGSTVTVVDAGEPGRKASWAASGILSLVRPQTAPPPLRELAAASAARWPEFAARLKERSGTDIQSRRSGLIRLVLSESSAASATESQQWLAAHDQPSEWVDRAGITALAPVASGRADRALYQPDQWQVRAPRLMQALVDGAIRADRITMLPFSPVTQLLIHGHRVQGVQFTTGTDLFADEVVVCAGAWTSQLLRPFEDIKLAICPIRGQLLCVATPYDPNLAGGAVILGEENEYVVPLVNGRWVVGSTFEDVGFDDRVTAGGLHEILTGAFAFAPKLAKGTILSHWAALRPSTPDGVPLIGRPSGVDGLVIAAGHFRNGLLLTPVTADIVHSLIHGEQAPVDLMPYAVERAPASNESPLLDAVVP